MPQYLEYRYDAGTRTLMAIFMLVAYVVVFWPRSSTVVQLP